MQYVNQRIAGALSVLVATLVPCGVCGYFNSFVPSQLMVTVAVWSASMMGLASAAFYGGFGAFGWHPGQQTEPSASHASLPHKRVKLPEKRYLRALLMGATVFASVWFRIAGPDPRIRVALLRRRCRSAPAL